MYRSDLRRAYLQHLKYQLSGRNFFCVFRNSNYTVKKLRKVLSRVRIKIAMAEVVHILPSNTPSPSTTTHPSPVHNLTIRAHTLLCTTMPERTKQKGQFWHSRKVPKSAEQKHCEMD